MTGADFTRTCEGREHVVTEPWAKDIAKIAVISESND